MNKGDQAKDNLEAKWLDTKLYLNNGLWNCTFASDDAPEKRSYTHFVRLLGWRLMLKNHLIATVN
jgi:hypothetical protein